MFKMLLVLGFAFSSSSAFATCSSKEEAATMFSQFQRTLLIGEWTRAYKGDPDFEQIMSTIEQRLDDDAVTWKEQTKEIVSNGQVTGYEAIFPKYQASAPGWECSNGYAKLECYSEKLTVELPQCWGAN